jgi:hypothetical protein
LAPFSTYQDYYQHLKFTHKLASNNIKEYIPDNHKKARWGKRKCPFPDCKTERVFKQQHSLKKHLRSKEHWKMPGHGLSVEEAKSKVQEMLRGNS